MPDSEVLVLIICCPQCGTEMEGIWLPPGDPDEAPEDAEQLCGECAHIWCAEWPGFAFRTEAG